MGLLVVAIQEPELDPGSDMDVDTSVEADANALASTVVCAIGNGS